MKVPTLITILTFFSSLGYSQNSDSAYTGKRIVPWFVERFKISAGFFYVVNKTNIQVEVIGSDGTEIDAEKDFGLNKEVGTFLANIQWRISSRSRINLSYYRINRSSEHKLKQDIIFEDNTYPANSVVDTYFNTTIYQFSYGYAIFSKPKYELGLLIGTHVVGSKAGITLVGSNAGVSQNNNFGITAPIPDLGIWGGFALSNRFAINFDADYLSLTVNDNTGRVLSTDLTFTYRIIDKLDLSLGYAGLNFKANATKGDVAGKFKWGYNGPAIAANFSFGKNSWGHLKSSSSY